MNKKKSSLVSTTAFNLAFNYSGTEASSYYSQLLKAAGLLSTTISGSIAVFLPPYQGRVVAHQLQ